MSDGLVSHNGPQVRFWRPVMSARRMAVLGTLLAGMVAAGAARAHIGAPVSC